MLLGSRSHAANVDPGQSEGDTVVLTKRLRYLEQVFDDWWQLWYEQCFQSLVVRQKWKQSQRNLSVGDLCNLKYEKKYGKPEFRLCVIEEVETDRHGLVRTVKVSLKARNSKEKPLPYNVKMNTMRVAVQRLVVVIPVEEMEHVEVFEKVDEAHENVTAEPVTEDGDDALADEDASDDTAADAAQGLNAVNVACQQPA